jgi:hypothetical protein
VPVPVPVPAHRERASECSAAVQSANCKLPTAEPEGRREHYRAMMMLQPARSALSPRPGPSRHHSPLASRSENSVAVLQSAVGGEELCKLQSRPWNARRSSETGCDSRRAPSFVLTCTRE